MQATNQSNIMPKFVKNIKKNYSSIRLDGLGGFRLEEYITRLMLNLYFRLSLPGKLVFPSTHNAGHFSMLGLGDIVMPGLLLCFVMRYDAYKRAQVIKPRR